MVKDNGLMKEDLEAIYGTVLTEKDVEAINKAVKGLSYDDIEEESRYFKDIQDYIEGVYLETDNSDALIQMLADTAEESPENNFTAESILVSDDDIKLENGGYIVVRV